MVSVSASYLMDKTKHRPKIAIICGSGLGKSCSNFLLQLLINNYLKLKIMLPIRNYKGRNQVCTSSILME